MNSKTLVRLVFVFLSTSLLLTYSRVAPASNVTSEFTYQAGISGQQDDFEWLKEGLVKYASIKYSYIYNSDSVDKYGEVKAYGSNDISNTISNVTINGCSISWTLTVTNRDKTTFETIPFYRKKKPEDTEVQDATTKSDVPYSLALADFDPISVKVSQTKETRKDYTLQPDIWTVSMSVTEGQSSKKGSVQIMFTDKDAAYRVAQIFKSQIKSCGGKVEPF